MARSQDNRGNICPVTLNQRERTGKQYPHTTNGFCLFFPSSRSPPQVQDLLCSDPPRVIPWASMGTDPLARHPRLTCWAEGAPSTGFRALGVGLELAARNLAWGLCHVAKKKRCAEQTLASLLGQDWTFFKGRRGCLSFSCVGTWIGPPPGLVPPLPGGLGRMLVPAQILCLSSFLRSTESFQGESSHLVAGTSVPVPSAEAGQRRLPCKWRGTFGGEKGRVKLAPLGWPSGVSGQPLRPCPCP